MTRIPSIKSLRLVFDDKAIEARRILMMNRDDLEALPAGKKRVRECYHAPTTQDIRFHCLDALGKTYGVEAFQVKNGDWVEYLNTGDTYTTTLLKFRGSYRVTDWGSIAEKWG